MQQITCQYFEYLFHIVQICTFPMKKSYTTIKVSVYEKKVVNLILIKTVIHTRFINQNDFNIW